jgi:hypothetical protein
MAVPEYGDKDGDGMASSSFWDHMASLTLCGKKVTNEQAKQIFAAMLAVIVVLVVVIISSAGGGADGGGDASSAVPSPSRSAAGGGSPAMVTGARTVPVGTSQSGNFRLNSPTPCNEHGCTGRIEMKAHPFTWDGPADEEMTRDMAADPTWGTVCGHWLWDSDTAADIVCRDLGYAYGTLYNFGTSLNAAEYPITAGFQVCEGTEASIEDCPVQAAGRDESGIHLPSRSCYTDPGSQNGCDSGCSHVLDQGAVCYAEGEVHHLQPWVEPCNGCGVGCGIVGQERAGHTQSVYFGCIDYFTAQCQFDATVGSRGSYARALNEFAECATSGGHVDGYCHGALTTAGLLANHDVCANGATTNIAFHIRIPFVAESAQTIHFRYHADFGSGSFIGVDGAEHTPGNLWGHVAVTDVALTFGDHEFEALGFEDCCDGHSELEVHLPCDSEADRWRVVKTGDDSCLSCDTRASLECTAQTESASVCGSAGSGMQCGQQAAPVSTTPGGLPAVRLADYPQGRIEVFSEGAWGTVCGHWFWDSNEGADMVCKQITDSSGNHPYAGGTVYTVGEMDDTVGDTGMPIVAGCSVCHPDDHNILSCGADGDPGEDDGPGWGDGTGECPAEDCHHRHDQGAICFTAESFVNWGAVADTVQPCAAESLVEDRSMALNFHCIEFASVRCSYDISGGTGSYDEALAAFAACEGTAQPDGYCSASISSAEFLSNQHVCASKSPQLIQLTLAPPNHCTVVGATYRDSHHLASRLPQAARPLR